MKLWAWLPKSCRWTSHSYFSVIAWACSSDSRLHDSCVNKGLANLKCSSLRGGTHRNSSGGMPGCNCFRMMSLLRDVALRDLWLPRLRADLTVSAQYRYVEKEPLECPIVVLSGNEDELSTEAGLNGWLAQTTAEVRYFRFAGNHFFLHSAEQLVLSRIAEELTKLIAPQPIGG